MSDITNPDDPRVHARARKLWEADGSPKGQEAEYVERARELMAIEDHPGAGLLPNPIQQYHGEIPPVQPIEEASIQENLGEFPERFTDQGEAMHTPTTPAAARKAREGG